MNTPEKKDEIIVGNITSTKGLKGEVKVKVFTEDIHSILDYPLFIEESIPLEIVSHYINKSLLIIKIKNINTIEEAKKLVGLNILTYRENLPDLDEDVFYHVDLIGLTVYSKKNQVIGTVIKVYNHGAGDILEVKIIDGNHDLFMFNKNTVLEVNIKEQYLVIDEVNYIEYKDLDINEID